jgi:uncharacterized protein YjiS (DUF1127 family)
MESVMQEMTVMPHAAQALERPVTGIIDALVSRTVSWVTRLQEKQKLARELKMLANLSDTQLKDIGIDPLAMRGARRPIEVEKGLMIEVISMRS